MKSKPADGRQEEGEKDRYSLQDGREVLHVDRQLLHSATQSHSQTHKPKYKSSAGTVELSESQLLLKETIIFFYCCSELVGPLNE